MANNDNLIPFKGINQEKTESGVSFDGEALKEYNIIGKKIAEARKALNFSQKELSDRMLACGMKAAPGAISKWEKGDTIPNAYQLLALCHCLKIQNPFEYFTGLLPESIEYSPELNQQGLNILQLFKGVLISSGQYAPKSRRYALEPEAEIEKPVYDEPAAAGPGTSDVIGSYEMISFPISSIPEDAEFGIRVSGISMLPRYVDRQIAWVEKCDKLYNGEIGVFFYDEKAYIKKYVEEMPAKDEIDEYIASNGCIQPKITLYSLNRDCADLDVHVKLGHQFSIVGRVLN
jgi:transcriptional regulator with XRE-family HTH domain